MIRPNIFIFFGEDLLGKGKIGGETGLLFTVGIPLNNGLPRVSNRKSVIIRPD